MEVHQLKYFVELARSGHFTQAAQACFVTQPTLSHQIRKLEEELGGDLFLRSTGRAQLTPLGEKIQPHILQVLKELHTIQGIANEFRDLQQGEIRIGAIPTIAPYLAPDLIGRFLNRYPQLHVGFTEEVTQNLLQQLHEGTLDFALVSPPFDQYNLLVRELPADELLVTGPVNHSLLRKKEITTEDLQKHPLVLMQEAHCLSQQVLQICNRIEGPPARVSIRSSQLETVQMLVELGMGVSFTPAMAIPFLSKRKVVHRRLGKQGVFRRIALAYSSRHPLTRAMQAFIDSLAS